MPILFVVFLSCKYSVLKLFMGVENVGIFFLGILPELKKCFGSSHSYISDLELCFLIFSG